MNIVLKDAETALLRHAIGWCPSAYGHAVVFVGPHARTEPERHTILVHAIKGQITQGALFCCANGDMVLWIPPTSQRVLESMISDVRYMLADYTLPIDLYHLPDAFARLMQLCQSKAAQTPGGNISGAGAAHPMTAFNTAHFALALQRRHMRKMPLVLIVEDQQFSRRLVQCTLKHTYDTATARTGKEALALYAAHAPDITLLDNGLPDLDGQSVLRVITQNDHASFVIMLTADADMENVARARDNGVRGYIAKPFTRGKLFTCLDQFHLHRRRSA